MRRSFRNRYVATAMLAFAISIGSAQTAGAQPVIYTTGFNGPAASPPGPYADAVLNVGTDTTTPGQDGWINTSGGGTNNIPVSNSATNGLVSLTTNGQDVRRFFNGNQTVSTGSIWLDAHVTVSAAQATGDYALHLSDGGTNNFNARVFFKSSGAGYVMAFSTGTSATPTYGATVLPFGTLTHILARYDFVSGLTNDTGALFVNPITNDGSGDTPYVAATTAGTDAVTLAAVALRQGATANAPTLTVDDLKVFATNPVPEPSTLALGGLAAAGFITRLRKRRTAA
jgi:hypothetical protein